MVLPRILSRAGRLHTKICSKSTVRALNSAVKPSTEVREIEVNMPWGKIAAKLWGSEHEQPILALHGWQDNAGSFDAIAPLLLKNVPVLAIDLPGHGFSSWISPGLTYHEFLHVMLIERLRRYFGWEKVKLMAHSLGAMTSFSYTSLFPEQVKFVIALDALKFPSITMANYGKEFAKSTALLLKLEKINTPPFSYTEEEIISRWQSAVENFTISESVCKMLMDRGVTKQKDGKYVFNRDPKVKCLYTFSMYTHEHSQQSAELITCPYMVIKAKETPYFDKKENFFEVINIMKQKNKNVFYEEISGSHHVHMEKSETVANILNPFIKKFNA